ncbi:FAD-dependent oxidoreductase, partial [Streptomyces sp. ISL-11]|uniref:FAD-dependent oxidoreductase n=1 Tax=Streptomyces sp. ISL-11 TaxID=2819174 RepID=UPI001BE91098
AGQVTVVGAGVAGVETAAALRRAGREVTLVHPGPYPLDDRLPDRAGRLLADHLQALGVTLEFGQGVAAREPGKVRLTDGRMLRADVLLPCPAPRPETALARAA